MEDERMRRLLTALRPPENTGAARDVAQDGRRDVAHHIRPEVAQNDPQDVAKNDLGVALIDLFARALDRVSAYAKQVAEEAYLESAAQRVRLDLPAVRRPRFFSGQILRAEDLQAQQDYFRERQRLQNRIAFGAGVAFGLSVTCGETATGARVVVAPGCAVDPAGELVTLRDETRVPVGLQLPAFVCIRYVERPCDPVPEGSEGALEPTRIEEGARITVESAVPDDGIALARLVQREGKTVIDPTFRPRRIGQARAR